MSDFKNRVIHVSVPVSVANDLKQMEKINHTVLGKLGCPGCYSGFDIRYLYEDQFRFNEKLEEMPIRF
jgi:hypothetical protein